MKFEGITMKSFFLGLAIALTSFVPANANEMEDALRDYLQNHIASWANDGVILTAIQSQNTQTSDYDQATIDEMDTLWRAYGGSPDAEIVQNVIQNAAADFLREQVAASGGAITEVFVMDARGLNVAASEPTSDYWQGDEDKFQKTYSIGPSAIHIGEIELDDSTKTVQSQVSITVVDQASGEAVGALTVGIDLTALM